MPLTLCQAVAQYEGFGPPAHRATRNNNPGDIEWGAFARMYGATRIEEIPQQFAAKEQPRFAYFPSVDMGFEAMKHLLARDYVGMTVSQMLNKYAPPSENNTQLYIDFVCEKCLCTPDTPISKVL